jgi:O-6-methylguanine DNA methyltransferase
MTEFQKKVYNATRVIPKGKVSTYAAIARAIGEPRASRAVGGALNRNKSAEVPCHRVIRSDGSTGGYNGGIAKKIAILKAEGVEVAKNHSINLKKYFWKWKKK